MAGSELTTRILLFSMILNIVFPVFAYSFTTITGSQIEDYDISISQQDLINAGIVFSSAQSLNITYGAGPIEFNISARYLRVNWANRLFIGDDFRFYRPSLPEVYIGDQTGNYFTANGETLRVESQGISYVNDFYNSTMVLNFDPDYNWTQVYVPAEGVIILFKTLAADDNNITAGVYDTGTLTATAGIKFEETQDFNFGQYVSWYMGMLFTNKSYGLPSEVNWLMRIFTAITLFSAIAAARDFLPIP